MATYTTTKMYGYGSPPLPISGEGKVTFGHFSLAEKSFVSFAPCDSDKFSLSLFKDKKCIKPQHREIINGTDICGLDWGSFIKQKKVVKVFYTEPKTYSYVTIICKSKSVTLIFPGDEGEQLNHWKRSLREMFYPSTFYLREKLKYTDKYVLIQAGKSNISLTSEMKDHEPARVLRSWHKDMFYNSQTNGSCLTLTFKSSSTTPDTVTLECDRDGFRDGQRVSKRETIKEINKALTYFTVGYFFTKSVIYTDTGIDQDYSDIYDLNKLEDRNRSVYATIPNRPEDGDITGIPKRSEDEIKSTMEIIYRKYKDNPINMATATSLTPEEILVLNVGFIIYQISRVAPQPDTLNLPPELRMDVCMKLYAKNITERSNDWTALASQIGITQGVVNIIQGMLANEMPIIPGAEIVLRHWQFTYNRTWDKPESEALNRPKLPCTREGLLTALKNIGRHNLVQTIENYQSADAAVGT